jgi:hypothetical protein
LFHIGAAKDEEAIEILHSVTHLECVAPCS